MQLSVDLDNVEQSFDKFVLKIKPEYLQLSGSDNLQVVFGDQVKWITTKFVDN